MWEEKLDFEDRQNDPSRYNNRGGNLAAELKVQCIFCIPWMLLEFGGGGGGELGDPRLSLTKSIGSSARGVPSRIYSCIELISAIFKRNKQVEHRLPKLRQELQSALDVWNKGHAADPVLVCGDKDPLQFVDDTIQEYEHAKQLAKQEKVGLPCLSVFGIQKFLKKKAVQLVQKRQITAQECKYGTTPNKADVAAAKQSKGRTPTAAQRNIANRMVTTRVHSPAGKAVMTPVQSNQVRISARTIPADDF